MNGASAADACRQGASVEGSRRLATESGVLSWTTTSARRCWGVVPAAKVQYARMQQRIWYPVNCSRPSFNCTSLCASSNMLHGDRPLKQPLLILQLVSKKQPGQSYMKERRHPHESLLNDGVVTAHALTKRGCCCAVERVRTVWNVSPHVHATGESCSGCERATLKGQWGCGPAQWVQTVYV